MVQNCHDPKHKIELWKGREEVSEITRKVLEEGIERFEPSYQVTFSLDGQKVGVRRLSKEEAKAYRDTHANGWAVRESVDFYEEFPEPKTEEEERAWNKSIVAKMGTAYYTLTHFFGTPSDGARPKSLWTFELGYKGNCFEIADIYGYKINFMTPEDVIPPKEIVEELREVIEYLIVYARSTC